MPQKSRTKQLKDHFIIKTMPLTKKGSKILGAMESEYGEEKGKKVFYASQNKGTITGTHKAKGRALHKAKK